MNDVINIPSTASINGGCMRSARDPYSAENHLSSKVAVKKIDYQNGAGPPASGSGEAAWSEWFRS